MIAGVSFGTEKFPLILGHEGAGVVESVGEGVTNFSPGDHVLPLYISQCNQCINCTQIKNNYCSMNRVDDGYEMLDGTTRFRCNGKVIYHFFGTSTFTEYTVCLASSIVKISPLAPLNSIGLFACGVSTGYGASLNTAGVRKGSSVAIWGMGTVGLSAVIGAKEAGAKEIIAIDINESKFALATKLGATLCLNPIGKLDGKTFDEVVKERYPKGFDFTIECAGKSRTIEAAFNLTSAGGGVCVVIGVADSNEIKIDPISFVFTKTIKGSIFGGKL